MAVYSFGDPGHPWPEEDEVRLREALSQAFRRKFDRFYKTEFDFWLTCNWYSLHQWLLDEVESIK